MNISPVTNGSGTSQKSSIVDALKQMKAELTNQLKKVDESSEDAKTKAEKKKQLNEQIAMVDAQIQQAMASEKQKEMQEASEKAAEKAAEEQAEKEKETGVVVSASLNKVLSLRGNMAKYQTQGEVRERLKGEMRVAQSQIDHNFTGGSVKYQLDIITGNSSKLAKVETEMGKTAGELREGVEESVKTGIKEAEKARENKGEKTAEQEKMADNGGQVASVEPPPAEAAAEDSREDGLVAPAAEKDKPGEERKQPKSVDVIV